MKTQLKTLTMPTLTQDYSHSKTSVFFYKISKYLVLAGMPGYIKWGQSEYSKAIYKHIQNVLTASLAVFLVLELVAPFTQKNLTEKQTSDMIIFAFSHLVLSSYPYVLAYHQERVKTLIYKLCIELKEVYNNAKVERQMIKKTTIYSVAFLMNLTSAVFSYGFDGITQALRGGTFVTVITAWPDVTDNSIAAAISRVVAYLMWWLCMLRVSAVFVLLIVTTGCMAFQFKNLQSYFYSLRDIFDADDENAPIEENLEQKYEEDLKVGIRLHSETLWCVSQCQAVFALVYTAQIAITVGVMALLMLQMMNAERTPATACALVITAIALHTGTGILMWNAGDITVEAARLPEAMYGSGWENCRSKSSQRVRKLLVTAINQAQRPVVIQTFGVMDVSYQAFVTMVKTSYSGFSLLY